MEKSVILLVKLGHEIHLFNALLYYNSRLDVIHSSLTNMACWIMAAKKEEKQVWDKDVISGKTINAKIKTYASEIQNLNTRDILSRKLNKTPAKTWLLKSHKSIFDLQNS